jgi:hypothetical protein
MKTANGKRATLTLAQLFEQDAESRTKMRQRAYKDSETE